MTRRLVVIGGGIGGYTAAIRGARHGLDVTLIEAGELGGTCLNVGCIPTKSLLHNSIMVHDLFHHLALAGQDGQAAPAAHVLGRLAAEKSSAVERLVRGVRTLVARNAITLLNDTASFTAERRLRLASDGRELEADFVVIATGSIPVVPAIEGLAGPHCLTSDEAVALKERPARLVIVGGGVIGVEFAQIFANLGTQVTILEVADRILAGEDREAVDVLAKSLSTQGVAIRTGTRLRSAVAGNGLVELAIEDDTGRSVLTVDSILVAVGRRPNVDSLGLASAGIATEHGAIAVDDRMRTGIPGVYAVGDVTGGPLLAHRAAAQAECALADILGLEAPAFSALAMPRAVYTRPEIASVGLTEAEASAMGEVKVGRFPFSANGKALVGGHAEGFVKIVADARHDQILGVTMVGPDVSNLLGEATLAVQMEMTLSALIHTVHAHPTLSEALVEAAHDARDAGAIHLPPARRARVEAQAQ
jgi:dihydrolipoamide dehydrogenase